MNYKFNRNNQLSLYFFSSAKLSNAKKVSETSDLLETKLSDTIIDKITKLKSVFGLLPEVYKYKQNKITI